MSGGLACRVNGTECATPCKETTTRIHDTEDQADIVVEVIGEMRSKRQLLMCIQGAAGTGKSRVLNAVAAWSRGEKQITMCGASTGVAACGMEGGGTIHSLLSVNFSPDDSNAPVFLRISKTSQKAEMIRRTKLITLSCSPRHPRGRRISLFFLFIAAK